MTDCDELRAIAGRVVSPGRWVHDGGWTVSATPPEDWGWEGPWTVAVAERARNDAEWIAAASPEVVIGLLDRIDDLTARMEAVARDATWCPLCGRYTIDHQHDRHSVRLDEEEGA